MTIKENSIKMETLAALASQATCSAIISALGSKINDTAFANQYSNQHSRKTVRQFTMAVASKENIDKAKSSAK